MSDHERQAQAPSAASAEAGSAATDTTSTIEGARERSEAEEHASTDPASEGSGLTLIESFEIECLNSARYHEDRETFFSFVNKGALFLIVLSGTAALSPLKEHHPFIFPLLITVLGLLNLVFDVSGKARLHAGLKKDVFLILADVKAGADLAKLRKRLTLVYADEPPVMYAVSAVAYNGAMTSRDRPSRYLMNVSSWARFWRHIWPYTANSFKRFEEVTPS